VTAACQHCFEKSALSAGYQSEADATPSSWLIRPTRTHLHLLARESGIFFRSKGLAGLFRRTRSASAALGARHFSDFIRVESDLVLKILDGLDYRTIPHFSDQFDISKIPGLRRIRTRPSVAEQRNRMVEIKREEIAQSGNRKNLLPRSAQRQWSVGLSSRVSRFSSRMLKTKAARVRGTLFRSRICIPPSGLFEAIIPANGVWGLSRLMNGVSSAVRTPG